MSAAEGQLRERLLGWIDDQRQLLPERRTVAAHAKAEVLRDLHALLAATAPTPDEVGQDPCIAEHPSGEWDPCARHAGHEGDHFTLSDNADKPTYWSAPTPDEAGRVHATGATVPERQRCICSADTCLDRCRACNHSGRDLEELCIADPKWEPDDYDLAGPDAARTEATR